MMTSGNNPKEQNGRLLELKVTEEHRKGKDETEEIADAPIDRGWAWVILAAATFQMFSVIGILKCGGIFFVLFQERFNSSASETSLITTVSTAVYCLCSLLVMTIGMKTMKTRTSLFIGATINVIAFTVTSLAPSIEIIYLSHGVLFGIGSSFMQTPSYGMIGQYFNKRRGLANSITAAGASAGGLVFAPLIIFLLGYYGYFGTMLLIAGFLANGWVVGSLFRPMEVYTSRNFTAKVQIIQKTESPGERKENGTTLTGEPIKQSMPSNLPQIKVFSASLENLHQPVLHRNVQRVKSSNQERSPFLEPDMVGEMRPRAWTVTSTGSYVAKVTDFISNSNVAKYLSVDSIVGSVQNLSNNVPERQDLLENETEEKDIGLKDKILKNIIHMFDFHLFKNPVFPILLLGQSLHISSGAICQVFIAPHSRDNGLSENQIATLVIITTSIEAVSRPIVGAVADKVKFDKTYLVVTSSIVLGICAQFITFYINFTAIAVYCAIIGLFGGVYMSLFTVILLRYCGNQKFQGAMGFTVLCNGIMVATMYYIIGVLRDVTGSYTAPFRLMGVNLFVAAVLLTLTSRLHQRQKRRKLMKANVNGL